jgi:molybdate transport system substrate-binding protein
VTVARRAIVTLAAVQLLAAAWAPAVAQSPTLRVFTTRAIGTVLAEVGPAFERANGCRLEVVTDIAAPMVRRVRSGEAFDVLVASPAQMDALVADGFIVPDTRVDLARSGIGVAVRSSAALPDVSTVDALKRTLQSAKSVAYLKEGQSGVYLAGLMDTLSLTSVLAPKLVRPERDIVSELVAKGEVEVGMVVVTQILTTPGVALAGPLPESIQNYIVFAGGVSAHSSAVATSRALMTFLASPAAQSVMRSQGMQPMPSLPR